MEGVFVVEYGDYFLFYVYCGDVVEEGWWGGGFEVGGVWNGEFEGCGCECDFGLDIGVFVDGGVWDCGEGGGDYY